MTTAIHAAIPLESTPAGIQAPPAHIEIDSSEPMAPAKKFKLVFSAVVLSVFTIVVAGLFIAGYGAGYALGLGFYLAFWIGMGFGLIFGMASIADQIEGRAISS